MDMQRRTDCISSHGPRLLDTDETTTLRVANLTHFLPSKRRQIARLYCHSLYCTRRTLEMTVNSLNTPIGCHLCPFDEPNPDPTLMRSSQEYDVCNKDRDSTDGRSVVVPMEGMCEICVSLDVVVSSAVSDHGPCDLMQSVRQCMSIHTHYP